MKTNTIANSILATVLLSATAGAAEVFISTTSFTLSDINCNWGGYNPFYAPPANFAKITPRISVNTTIELDLGLQQIRVFGTVSPTQFNDTTSRSQTQTVGDQFPYTQETATLNLDTSIAIPSFSFDSGIQIFEANSGNYVFDGPQISFLAQVTFDQTLSTGGELYFDSDSFSKLYTLESSTWIINAGFYPSLVSVSPIGRLETSNIEGWITNFKAPNGFQSDLMVPEPSSLLMFGASLSLLFARRRRGLC